ncbi:dihydrodipicolinate synthase family protein [Lapidilactobacillus salsurivasis]
MKFDTSRIKGIIVPLLTPVDQDENIDEAKLRFIVEHVITHGVHGILAFGSNSEFYMFDDDEMVAALEIILDQVNNRIPVFFGVGSIRTKHGIRLAKRVANLPIEGISILQPMFIRPTDEALYHHFKAIADAVPAQKILIYNNPGRTGYALSLDVIDRLAHNVDNIVGIKESSGDITIISELIRRQQDLDFKVFAGKDTVVYPSLCVGAAGAVCSTANMFPELVAGIYNDYQAGQRDAALARQFKLNPIRLSQDGASFPAATKDMANLLGLDVGNSVLPTEATTGPAYEKMVTEITKAGFLDK